MKKYKGSLLLLLCAAIWGFAFAAQSSAADSVPPFTFNGIRSFMGAFVLLAFLLIKGRIKGESFFPENREDKKNLIISGIACGIILFIATNLQQYGITVYPAEASASGRAGFITALYVVLVPIFSIILKKKIHLIVWLAAVIAVIGMYFLCFKKGEGLSGVYFGDLLIILCALCFAGHIVSVDYFVQRAEGIKISCIQFFVSALLSSVCALIFEKPDFAGISESMIALLYAGVCSTGIAYTLQIVGQETTPPALASIICSFESVFAAIGGWLVLGERLSSRELIGCAIMFAAVIMAQVPEFFKDKKLKSI